MRGHRERALSKTLSCTASASGFGDADARGSSIAIKSSDGVLDARIDVFSVLEARRYAPHDSVFRTAFNGTLVPDRNIVYRCHDDPASQPSFGGPWSLDLSKADLASGENDGSYRDVRYAISGRATATFLLEGSNETLEIDVKF